MQIRHRHDKSWFQRLMLSRAAGVLLLLGLVATSYAIVVNISSPVSAAGNPCGDCVDGWIALDVSYGGRECSHGPDTDNDCNWWNNNVGFGAGCCETQGGKKFTVGGVEYTVPNCNAANACKCFECFANACEGENMHWAAHCGIGNTPWGAGQQCNLENAGNGPLRKNRTPDPPPQGFACNGAGAGDGNTHYQQKHLCGGTLGGSPTRGMADCTADNCPPSSQPWVELAPGPRMKCKT